MVIEGFDITELKYSEEDPAGGVVLPRVHREIARARGLAGAAVGLSAKLGVAAESLSTTTSALTLPWLTTTSATV
jgi:hypothetical protein